MNKKDIRSLTVGTMIKVRGIDKPVEFVGTEVIKDYGEFDSVDEFMSTYESKTPKEELYVVYKYGKKKERCLYTEVRGVV